MIGVLLISLPPQDLWQLFKIPYIEYLSDLRFFWFNYILSLVFCSQVFHGIFDNYKIQCSNYIGLTNCKNATLQRIIKGNTCIDSVIHSDGWHRYNWIVDFGCKKHFSKSKFARDNSHINDIESFFFFWPH